MSAGQMPAVPVPAPPEATLTSPVAAVGAGQPLGPAGTTPSLASVPQAGTTAPSVPQPGPRAGGPQPPGTTALLSLRSLTRTFRRDGEEDLHILTGIDLNVAAGEHVAIVGRSGTGKSTLLNILGLIDLPTSGLYHLEGTDTATLNESRRAHLRGATFGFVFQTFNLIEGLTTTENVAAPLLYDRGRAFWTRSARARELLEAVGLREKIDSPVNRLSGGEQQRVAIARALARRPRVILADEPTGALDVDTGAAVMDLLEAQCRDNGAALIVITHDLAVASRATSQYRLEGGVLTPIRAEVASHGSLETLEEVPR